MLASILGSTGAKIGLFTSPHLSSQNERIVIDGFPVSDVVLNAAAKLILEKIDILLISLSYFEAITLCAFIIFDAQGVDWAIIEVGLGGRLDATNVIADPRATVIVTIGLDHQQILGSSLAEIAAEKAGIAKSGVPMIVGDLPIEALVVVEKHCKDVGSPTICWGRDYSASSMTNGSVIVRSPKLLNSELIISPTLIGRHQLHNATVAAVTALTLGVSHAAIERGVRSAFWPGRLEFRHTVIGDVLFDAAHNPDGMKALVDYLELAKLTAVRMVFGVVGDKCWQEMIKLIAPRVSEWHLVRPMSSRALELAKVADFISCGEIKSAPVKIYSDGVESLIASMQSSSYHGLTLVAGSIYLTGAVRYQLVNEDRPLWSRIK